MHNRRRVLVISLDGGTWYLLRPLIEEGWMPNLKRLVDTGQAGILHSTIPPITATAWSSFLTGVNPGKHGVYSFADIDRYTFRTRFVNSSSLRVKTIWEYLSENDKRVISVNVPMTYPPKPVNGIIIGGMLTPRYDAIFTYPPTLKKDLEEQFGEPWIVVRRVASNLKNDREQHLARYIQVMNNRISTSLYLLSAHTWDLFMIHFQSTDWVQHSLWQYLEKNHSLFGAKEYELIASRFYQRLDEGIGKIQQAAERQASSPLLTVIISDHGFQAHRKIVNLSGWLHKQGFSRPKKGGSSLESITRFLLPLLRKVDIFKLRRILLDQKIRLHWMRKYMRAQVDLFVRPLATSSIWGYIFLNEKIDSQARESLLNKLQDMVDPADKKKIIRRIYKKEELYQGDQLDHMPDLILEPAEGYTFSASPFTEHWELRDINPMKDYQVGTHHLDGIVVFASPHVRQNSKSFTANILDITPTLIYYLGLSIPKYMDGKVLHNVFNDELHTTNELRYINNPMKSRHNVESAYTVEDESEIRRQLKDLGYLD